MKLHLVCGAVFLAALSKAHVPPSNCHDHWLLGSRTSGQYEIDLPNGKIKVTCVMDKNGGQTLLHRNSNVLGWKTKNMTQPYSAYVKGFGSGDGYWIGLESLNHLTNRPNTTVRIAFTVYKSSQPGPEQACITYSHFKVGAASTNYKLSCTNQTVKVPQTLAEAFECGTDTDQDLDNQEFTTYDKDNDKEATENCASHGQGKQPGWNTWEDGAWWYKSCGVGYLNADGRYYFGTVHESFIGQWWPTYGFIFNGTAEMHLMMH